MLVSTSRSQMNTDCVSHAVTPGQFAFVQTFLVPHANCRLQELVPLNPIKGDAA